MTKRAVTSGAPRQVKGRRLTRNVPISLRFSPELRERVRRYAAERQIEEATAIRLLCAERLNEIERDAELSEAEEWQRAQAWASWERVRAGQGRDVPAERIARVFSDALAERDRTSPAR